MSSIIIYLTLFFIVNLNPIEGTFRVLSDEENLELDRELTSLNKPAVKTIRTLYGDIYDCVDVYKQPALDHPFLKDHKIQVHFVPSDLDDLYIMQRYYLQTIPSFVEKTDSCNARASRPSRSSSGLVLDQECPSGTVPIRRTTKEELLRAKTIFREQFSSSYRINENLPKLFFAGISTEPKQTTVYHGAGGYINICNPTVEPGQLSASVISIEGGTLDSFSSIRIGWMVNIDLFQDNRTRLYTIWGQATGGVFHGCYNTYCSGFVQTDSTIPLGMVLEPVSVLRGTQYYVALKIYQDKETGNWWLMYGENGTRVGYWSSTLFTNLKSGAETLSWGGMASSRTANVPPMGNGDNGELHSCHFRHVTLTYEAGSGLNGTMDVPLNVVGNKCYKAGDNSYKGDYWGYSFYFGGNGGDVNECSHRI